MEENFELNPELPIINRGALIIERKQPFVDWINSCPENDGEVTIQEVNERKNVYLIPDIIGEPDNWIRRNFKRIFENELYEWFTDDFLWPEKRTFREFKQFFKYEYSSMVIEMGDGGIIIEDF